MQTVGRIRRAETLREGVFNFCSTEVRIELQIR